MECRKIFLSYAELYDHKVKFSHFKIKDVELDF